MDIPALTKLATKAAKIEKDSREISISSLADGLKCLASGDASEAKAKFCAAVVHSQVVHLARIAQERVEAKLTSSDLPLELKP